MSRRSATGSWTRSATRTRASSASSRRCATRRWSRPRASCCAAIETQRQALERAWRSGGVTRRRSARATPAGSSRPDSTGGAGAGVPRHDSRRLRPARRRAATRTRACRRPSMAAAPLGVNVAGYINAESGMGEATRCSIRALSWPACRWRSTTSRARSGWSTRRSPSSPTTIRTPSTSCTSTPTTWTAFARRARRAVLPGSLHDRLLVLGARDVPRRLAARPSTTSTKSGSRPSTPAVHRPRTRRCPSCTCRCRVLPDPPPTRPRALRAARSTGFVFLYTFDVSSQMERKNPLAPFARSAWPRLRARRGRCCVLKFTNGQHDRDAVRRLAEAADGLNVMMLDGDARPRRADRADARHRLLRLAAPRRGLRPDDRRSTWRSASRSSRRAYSGNVDFMTAGRRAAWCRLRIVADRRATTARTCAAYIWADPDLGPGRALSSASSRRTPTAPATGRTRAAPTSRPC